MDFIDFLNEESEHVYKSDSSKFKLKDIFADHWDAFLLDNPDISIRPCVLEEVQKMIGCGSLSNGYAVYSCSSCSNYLFVPFTCKSRFCPSCGSKSVLDRSDSITAKTIRCSHRHITFTIHNDLWPLFQKDRNLLNLLFDAASQTILSWCYTLNKKENFKPGFVCTLHTFGRDLKWNPHIHMLITEGFSGNFTVWKNNFIFPFEMLRRRFQTILLNLLEPRFDKSYFISLKNHIYKTSSKGFYVHAPKVHARDIKSTIKYVIRYSGKPAMAQSRIIDYDGEFVTFWYDRHEDNKRVTEKIHVYDFFKRLIIHIPDKYFNMIRYYGLYAKEYKNSNKLIKMMSPISKKIKAQLRTWQNRIELYFKRNPLACSCCGKQLHFDYLVQKAYNST